MKKEMLLRGHITVKSREIVLKFIDKGQDM